MFNYALHRNKVPPKLQQEEFLFNKLPFAQKLQQDATALAQTMVYHGLKDAVDAYDMRNGNVQYWDYVEMFHPKYKDKVLRKAEELAKQLSNDFQNHPEKFPMPAPQQGGAGGAPPGGAMASLILPDGRILIKKASVYSVKVDGEEITFLSEPADAIRVAMEKIAARETSKTSGKITEG